MESRVCIGLEYVLSNRTMEVMYCPTNGRLEMNILRAHNRRVCNEAAKNEDPGRFQQGSRKRVTVLLVWLKGTVRSIRE